MHGVPPDLPLARFLGEACILIEIAQFEIVFVFPDAGTIRVHGGWELRDGSGRMIDRMQEHDERDGYHIHKIINSPVQRFDIDSPASFTLHFENDHSLQVFDDDDHYETFSIEPDGIYISARPAGPVIPAGVPVSYDDDYPTCARTYATLRIYPGEIDPATVTDRLGIEPTRWQRRGEMDRRSDRSSKVIALNGWFLGSKGEVESRDSRRHIDWILDRVEPKAEAIRSLQEEWCRMDVSCFWTSQRGHGGPSLPAAQLRRLADLNLELWFDFYGPYED